MVDSFINDSSGDGSREPMAVSPLWVQYSGLPEWLNQKINRQAWSLFKAIMEADCARNSRPETVEITPAELARMAGIDADAAMRILE
ncbi:MAG: hypothetical protein ACOC54_06095, partial [Candidatus Sumerlaeota bacterium]